MDITCLLEPFLNSKMKSDDDNLDNLGYFYIYHKTTFHLKQLTNAFRESKELN